MWEALGWGVFAGSSLIIGGVLAARRIFLAKNVSAPAVSPSAAGA